MSSQHPRTYLENEDIRCVASPYASSSECITTPVLSAEMKHVLLERLEKEIMSKIGGSICRSASDGNLSGKKRRRESQNNPATGKGKANEKAVDEKGKAPMRIVESVVRSRFIVGINQCTRTLESAYKHKKEGQQQSGSTPNPIPSLILLARDVRPATILAHISLYANLLNIPTLILPGKASLELGKAVGIRSVAVAAFVPSERGEGASMPEEKQKQREWKETQNDVDSFIKYVVSKIPK